MFRRNLIGVIATSGIVAAVGYLLIPRRRKWFGLNMKRLPVSFRNLMNVVNMGRTFMRGFAR